MIDNADLYLLRHGIAADKSASNTYEEDYVRPLTVDGVRQADDAGKVLRQIAPRFHACYTSPRIRTVQTAVLACQHLKGNVTPERDKDLLNMSMHDGQALIKDHAATLIVGHGPELNELVKKLTGRDVDLSRGAVAGIHVHNGQGSLTNLLTPKDIAGIV